MRKQALCLELRTVKLAALTRVQLDGDLEAEHYVLDSAEHVPARQAVQSAASTWASYLPMRPQTSQQQPAEPYNVGRPYQPDISRKQQSACEPQATTRAVHAQPGRRRKPESQHTAGRACAAPQQLLPHAKGHQPGQVRLAGLAPGVSVTCAGQLVTTGCRQLRCQ